MGKCAADENAAKCGTDGLQLTKNAGKYVSSGKHRGDYNHWKTRENTKRVTRPGKVVKRSHY